MRRYYLIPISIVTVGVLIFLINKSWNHSANIVEGVKLKPLVDTAVVISETPSSKTVAKIANPKPKIKGNKIVLANGEIYDPKLYNLSLVGFIDAETKDPYLVMSGRQCMECDANISIYIQSPSDGSLKNEASQARYSYPGSLYDYQTDSLLSESRMFFGEVLPERFGVIWYQQQLDTSNNWVSSVYFAEVIGDTLNGNFVEASMNETLAQIRKRLASELARVAYTSEP